jgi:hypothetical protein
MPISPSRVKRYSEILLFRTPLPSRTRQQETRERQDRQRVRGALHHASGRNGSAGRSSVPAGRTLSVVPAYLNRQCGQRPRALRSTLAADGVGLVPSPRRACRANGRSTCRRRALGSTSHGTGRYCRWPSARTVETKARPPAVGACCVVRTCRFRRLPPRAARWRATTDREICPPVKWS